MILNNTISNEDSAEQSCRSHSPSLVKQTKSFSYRISDHKVQRERGTTLYKVRLVRGIVQYMVFKTKANCQFRVEIITLSAEQDNTEKEGDGVECTFGGHIFLFRPELHREADSD